MLAVRWKFAVSTALAGLALAVPGPTVALARNGGLAADACGGCHNGGPSVRVAATPGAQAVAAGTPIRLRVTVTGAPGAGVHVWRAEGQGTFVNLAGEGTRLDGTDSVVHATPKRASGSATSFEVEFRPAAGTAGVLFGVAAVGANLDGRRQGDASAETWSTVAVGCAAGQRYYRDFDGDGHGRPDPGLQILACARPPGYADTPDDCDDNDERRAPGKPELCNGIDDDCNDMIDDGLPTVLLYPDGDGDGYGRPGEARVGCGPVRGYGVGTEDCDDGNPDVHPGAVEVCNYRDDNCNGRTDEDARTICGVGWCRRYAPGCDALAMCQPGPPRAERCNYFDDDCDGETDEDPDICPQGQACVEGRCVFSSDPSAPRPIPDGDGPEEAEGAAGPRTRGTQAGCAFAPGRARGVTAFLALVLALAVGWRRCRRGQGTATL